MKNQHVIEKIAAVLLVIGGLDLGIMGLFGMDVIASVFGDMSGLTRIIYVLIGLSAIYRIAMWLKTKSK